jgi:soluble lytic murein transglycosylase-like protein
MTPFARLSLASGIGLVGLVASLHMPHLGSAHDQTYVVQANDTLSGIASRFHISLWTLMRFNVIANPDQLQVGEVLTVPDGGDEWPGARSQGQFTRADRAQTTTYQAQTTTYVPAETGMSYIVQAGDTLGELSNRFGVPLATLAAANGISSLDLVQVGQRLVIPGQATGGTSTAPGATLRLVPATSTPDSTTGTFTGATSIGVTTGPSLSSPATSRSAVGALLTTEANAYGIDPALVKAVAWQESGWQMVVARDGGIGVMQLMPATAAWVGPDLLGRTINPYNVTDNIQAGVALLASYLRQYGGNVQMALAAYNEGPQNLAHGILSSTAQYIANVLALRGSFAQ